MSLSENIRKHRERIGFSQEMLAESMDVSRQAVSKWETGLSSPSTQKLIALAELFHVSVTDLINDLPVESLPPKTEESEAPPVSDQREKRISWKRIAVIAIVATVLIGTGILLPLLLKEKPAQNPEPTAQNHEPTVQNPEPTVQYPVYLTETYPEAVATQYAPKGLSESELLSLYDENLLTAGEKIKFLCYDYRSTGCIYALDGEVYDKIVTTSNKLGEWSEVNKKLLCIVVNDTKTPFSSYDNWYWKNQPYIRKIGDKCFLWFSNIVGLADHDGGWENKKDCVLIWYQTENDISADKNGEEVTFTFVCEPNDRLFVKAIENDYTVLSISEDIFGSLVYTGNAIQTEDEIWYEVDKTKVGVYSVFEKYPEETVDVEQKMTLLSSDKVPANVNIYTKKDTNGKYHMKIYYFSEIPWFMSTKMSPVGRSLFCWYNANGELCQQTFIHR